MTQRAVEEMQEELNNLKPILEQKNSDNLKLLDRLKVSREEVKFLIGRD